MTDGRKISAIIVWIFAATSALTIAGLVYKWFFNPAADLVFFDKLVVALILEAIASAFILFRRTFRFNPQTTVCKHPQDFEKFFASFVTPATSIDIFTNRLSWVSGSNEMQNLFSDLARKGKRLRVFSATDIQASGVLTASGVRISQIPTRRAPEARFTLINQDRPGAEKLAIALGAFPDHVVYVFDSNSGPHLIGLAKEVIALASIPQGV